MKNFYLFLTLVLCSLNISAQIVNIPDPALKNLLLANADTNSDHEIQVSEALAINSLEVNGSEITDLTGLNAFTNLTNLSLKFININGPLTLSNFTHLESLDFFSAQFTSIDFSGMISLTSLYMSSVSIDNLTFNNLPHLAFVWLDSIPATHLEFSSLPLLTTITVNSAPSITTLNLSGLPNLIKISLSSIPLADLNINSFVSLQEIYLDSLGITSLDISGLANLKRFSCSFCPLISINTSGANAIKEFATGFCQLSSLDVSQMTQLEVLEVINNKGFDSSASGLTSLNLQGLTHLKKFHCSVNSISNLDLSDQTQLIDLDCSSNLLTQLDVSMLTQLQKLNCIENQISSLNVLPLTQLEFLACASNQISTLDLSSLTLLKLLRCNNNLLTNLNLAANPQLNELDCSNNQISSMDFAANPEIKIIACNFNPLTQLNLTSQNRLRYLSCNHTLITTADVSHFDVSDVYLNNGSIDLSDNPNLEYINAKYGTIDIFVYGFNVTNSPNLRYICATEDNIAGILERLQLQGLQNISVNSYCTFTPGGAYNTIAGTNTYDMNGNGCDSADFLVPLTKMNIDDGTQTGATFTNILGNYSFFTQAGNYTITPTLENPYFTVTPASTEVNFSSVNNTTQTRNFCFAPNGVHPDVEISFLPNLPIRPGFNATFSISFKNKGNQIQSGSIDLTFDDAVLDLLSVSLPVDNQSVNHLVWNYSNLYPFETRAIYLEFNVNAPTETPPVNIDDVLSFTASINPITGDETPDDNTFVLNETVIGSYDPNDKTCLEGENITPEMVGDYLHYMIRFQNTGTAPAEFVVVKDMLDTAVFDVNSLQLIASSHPMTTRITGNKAEFIFQNINLPAESADESGSHGFVAFKIKTKNNLILGNAVKNKAEIYFDYNFPIITNQTTTTVSLLALDEFGRSKVSMTPNPVKNILNITANSHLQKVELLDLQGRVLESHSAAEHQTSLDLSGKARGMYLVRVTSELGSSIQKIIKE